MRKRHRKPHRTVTRSKQASKQAVGPRLYFPREFSKLPLPHYGTDRRLPQLQNVPRGGWEEPITRKLSSVSLSVSAEGGKCQFGTLHCLGRFFLSFLFSCFSLEALGGRSTLRSGGHGELRMGILEGNRQALDMSLILFVFREKGFPESRPIDIFSQPRLIKT